MKRGLLILMLLPCLHGCGTTVAEQVYVLNEEGVAALRRHNYPNAQKRFEEAVKLDPTNATSLYNLANTAHQAGDWPLAEQNYLECLKQQPDHGPAHHGLALLMVQQNRSAEAWQFIETWLTKNPKLADANAEHGWLLRESGDLPSAQAQLQKALELDPTNVRGLIELGILYESYSYPDRARSLYQRALQKEPQQMEALGRLASLKRTEKNPSNISAAGNADKRSDEMIP